MIQSEKVEIGQGGEILSAEITVVKKIKAEEYCQLYIKDNDEYCKLTKSEANILSVCILMSTYYDDETLEYPGNIIHTDKMFRDEVVRRTDLKEGTIRNTLVTLTKKSMLIKDKNYQSVYYLNPKYFFKGTISNRTRLIKKTEIWENDKN